MSSIESNLKTLIEIGSKGFFRLFESNWKESIKLASSLSPTKNDIKKIKKVLYKIGEYKSIERQRLAIGSLPDEERSLFIKEFVQMVEGYILDEDPNLH